MRQFNADRMADLELRMWQAYYAKHNVRLFGLVVTTLHEQYRYSWAMAAVEGFHLARAAAAALRDAQAPQPDWTTIGELLRRSYRDLQASLTTVNARAAG